MEERKYTREQILTAMRACFSLAPSAYLTPTGDVLPVSPTDEEETEQDEIFFAMLDGLNDGRSVDELKRELFEI